MKDFLLIAPIILPLITAIVLLYFWRYRKIQRIINIITSFLLLVIGIVLLIRIREEGIQVTQPGSWPAPFGITIVADLLSAVMVLLTGLKAFVIAIYSIASMDRRRERFGYYALLNIMYMGICGAVLTGDIFNLYVWFEVMLISSFVLLSLGGEKAQLEGTIKYVTINLLSSVIFLAAVGILYGITGTLNMADLALQVETTPNQPMIMIVAMLFMITFGIKSAIFPLFFWLPASYHTPPIAISAIFAGLLTKIGIYANIRVFSLIFINNIEFTHTLLLILAGFTMVTGVLGAAAQGDMRRILSFHIISQIGYMLMGLALFTPLAVAGSVFYIIHHIIVKANLFLVSGIVHRLKGSFSLKKTGGFFKSHPFLSVCFLIPALSLAGLPPLSGFWSKLLLVKAGLEIEQYLIVGVSLAVGLLTLYSMTKIWNEVFWKNFPSGRPQRASLLKARSVFAGHNIFLIIPVIILAALTLFIGFFPEPLFILAKEAAEQLMNPHIYIDAVNPVHP